MACTRGERQPGARRDPAQALVELALILPLLLLLSAGLIELGRVFLALGSVEAAAYRGATFAAFSWANALDRARVREVVVTDWGPFPVSSSNPEVMTAITRESLARTDGLHYDAVAVTVAYAYTPLLAWPGVPVVTRLERTVTMRIQP